MDCLYFQTGSKAIFGNTKKIEIFTALFIIFFFIPMTHFFNYVSLEKKIQVLMLWVFIF